MTRTAAIIAAVVVIAGLVATGAFVWRSQGGDRFAECGGGAVGGDIGGPFELTDQTGARVTDEDVIDGPTLIYFGFTYCPDVCPLDLSRNADAVALLEERGIEIKPVMITVDPARDTPDQIGDYVEWMHPRMIGLTGSQADIDAAKDAYRVYAARRDTDDTYVMDHTRLSYLMVPDEGLIGFFRGDETVEQVADRLSCYVENL